MAELSPTESQLIGSRIREARVMVVAGTKKEGQGYRAILSFQLVLILVLSAGAKPLKGKTK